MHQLQIAFRSNFALNEAVKIVKNVTQCKVVKNITHNVVNERLNINAWNVWTTLCCEFVYCEYSYNISIMRVLKTINEKAYTTMFFELHKLLRSFFFWFFRLWNTKKIIIFNVSSSDWNNTNEVLKYQDKLYLSTIIQSDLLIRNHNNSLTSYFGIEKTFELFKRKYYWPNLKEKANAFSEMK